MKIRTNRTISNGRFIAEMRTESFTQAEEELFDRWGEPEVDVGGDFTELTGGEDFSLSSSLRKVRSDFQPYVFSFDEGDFSSGIGEAEDRALTVQAAIEARILAKMAELKATASTFEGEAVVNVP